jgi:hypothetical protein
LSSVNLRLSVNGASLCGTALKPSAKVIDELSVEFGRFKHRFAENAVFPFSTLAVLDDSSVTAV